MTLVIELAGPEGVGALRSAVAAYKSRLEVSIQRSRRRLEEFEHRYSVSTAEFLTRMTAEDLAGGDLEYVEWAGEARLLAGLESELRDLDHVQLQLR